MKSKIKISKKEFNYMVIFFCMIYPESFKYNNISYLMMSFLQIIVFLGVSIRYLPSFLNSKISSLKIGVYLLNVYAIYSFFNTYALTNEYISGIRGVIVAYTIGITLFHALNYERIQCYSALKRLFVIYFILEILTNILRLEITFLFSLNRLYILFPLMGMIFYLLDFYLNVKYHSIIFIGYFISVVLLTSMYMKIGFEAGFIISTLIFIVGLMPRKRKQKKQFTMWAMFLCVILGELVFVIWGIQDQIPIVRYIITDIFHKSIDVSGRGDLWKASLALIEQNPIRGVGSNWKGISIWYGLFQPHNQILYELIIGGGVGLGIYLFYQFYTCLIISRAKSKTYKICQYAMFISMLRMIVVNAAFVQMMPVYIVAVIAISECERNHEMLVK